MITIDNLPKIVEISEYGGNYHSYIDAVYDIFYQDFIAHKTAFGFHQLRLKFNPLFQERAYTFYHMTHKGLQEDNREPDLRRCERMPWARPAIENVLKWNLRFWRQTRKNSENRVCILLEVEDDYDYFVILEVRETYVLLWTAFVSEYSHETKKKLKEYDDWMAGEGKLIHTPDELVAKIQRDIKSKRRH
jgi:hypothetical protein